MKKYGLLVFIFLFCNKLPIGEDELNQRGDFEAQEFELTRYNTLTEYDKFAELGKSYNLIIGKNSDYESRLLLRFNFPDSSYQGLDEIKLILKRNKDFEGDTLKFSVHLVEHEFNEAEANWYLRTETDWWDSAGGDFKEDSLRLAEITGDSVVVRFNYLELEEIRAAEGLILIPEESGFAYFSSKESGTGPQFILEKNNEVTPIVLDADCHIMRGPEPFYIENWLGSGVPFRNYAKFVFDSLLLDKRAIYAELSFRIEKYFAMRDSVEIGIKELLEPIDDFDTPTGSFIAIDKFAVTDTVFKIDIVRHIQRIIEHPDSNFGFFIILTPENYDLANFKIVDGSHRLTVGYVSPPGGR